MKCSCQWTGVQWACCLWWCIHFLSWCRITNLLPRAGKRKKTKTERKVRVRCGRGGLLPYHTRWGWQVHWPWFKPELERQTSPPSNAVRSSGPPHPPKSQGHTADTRSGGRASAGGMEAAHSPLRRATTVKPGEENKNVPKETGQVRLREMSQSHYREWGKPGNSDPSRAVDAAHLPPKTLQKSVCLQMYL